jgi:hypothetical protein
VPLDGFDRVVERAEIEPLDERPDEAGAVVGRQQRLEIDRPQLELCPVRPLHPRLRVHRRDGILVRIR